jgi:hypothetical protein
MAGPTRSPETQSPEQPTAPAPGECEPAVPQPDLDMPRSPDGSHAPDDESLGGNEPTLND